MKSIVVVLWLSILAPYGSAADDEDSLDSATGELPETNQTEKVDSPSPKKEWRDADTLSDYAQFSEMTLEELLGVVLTTSRARESLIDSPWAVSVISRERIARLNSWTLPEILHFAVGADVIAHSVDSFSIGLRGLFDLGSNNILVLIDGHPITSDYDGGTDWSSIPISILDIDRIEIVRGPVSSIYGANAFVGVINIIRRPPGVGGSQFAVDGTYPRGFRLHAKYSGKAENVGWSLGVRHQQGRYLVPSDRRTSNSLAFDAHLSVGSESGHSFDVTAGASLSNETSFTRYFPLGFRAQMQTFFQSAKYEKTSLFLDGRDSLKIEQSWHHHAVQPLGPDRFTRDINRLFYDRVDGDISYRLAFSDIDQTTIGLFVRSVGLTSESVARGAVDLLYMAAYARERLSLGKLITLHGSFRWDQNSFVSDGRGSFGGGLVWSLHQDHTLRLTGGSSFRHPALAEAVGDFRDPCTGLIYLAGPGTEHIDPPSHLSVEVGYRGRWFSDLVIDLGLFGSRFSDLIFQDHRAIPSVFENTTGMDIIGGELDMRWQLRSDLQLQGGYAYHHPLDDEGEKQLRVGAEHLAHLSVDWTPVPALDLLLGGRLSTAYEYSMFVGVPPLLINEEIDPVFHVVVSVDYDLPWPGLTAGARAFIPAVGLSKRESPYQSAATNETSVMLSLMINMDEL